MSVNPLAVLKELSFERLAGSSGEKKAADIIKKHITSFGLELKEEEFELHSFNTGTASLRIAGKEFQIYPFGINKNCKMKGEFLFLENPEIMRYNKGIYRDKIILSYGFGRRLYEVLQEQQPAAFIAIGSPFREASSSSHRQSSISNGYINSATIDYKTALKLIKLSGKEAEFEISQSVQKKKAKNLIVDIEGTNPDRNLTYLVAHYDSVARTTGASDNAGGTVSLIKIAEYFAKKRAERNLRLIFFSGEELGLLGSQAYVNKHKEEMEQEAGLVINIDVSGDPIAKNKVVVTGSKELLGYSEGVSRELGHFFEHSLDIYSSDQMPFTQFEIPGLSFARFAGSASFHIHTPNDHHRFVSAVGLKAPIETAKYFLQRVLNASIYPIRKEIDGVLREKIENYFWMLNYQTPDLKWKEKYKK